MHEVSRSEEAAWLPRTLESVSARAEVTRRGNSYGDTFSFQGTVVLSAGPLSYMLTLLQSRTTLRDTWLFSFHLDFIEGLPERLAPQETSQMENALYSSRPDVIQQVESFLGRAFSPLDLDPLALAMALVEHSSAIDGLMKSFSREAHEHAVDFETAWPAQAEAFLQRVASKS